VSKDPGAIQNLEKMISSNCNCVWFHTLKNEDKATIPSILNKSRNSFDILSEKKKSVSSAKLLLVFVVLDKKLLYSSEFQLAQWDSNLPTDRKELKKGSLAPK
jgi:hypothetical protein